MMSSLKGSGFKIMSKIRRLRPKQHQCEYVGLLLWSYIEKRLSLLLFVIECCTCGRIQSGLSSLLVGTRRCL